MKKMFILFLLLFVVSIIYAQYNPINWFWARDAGGPDSDYSTSIVYDSQNYSAYVTGYYYDTITFGSTVLTNSGGYDLFIAKLNYYGNWVWAKRVGGVGDDLAFSVSVDNAGNILVAGAFEETITFGSTVLTSNGGHDAFIAKLDPNGNWIWAIDMGGIGDDIDFSIAVDNTGNIFTTGIFEGTATFGSTVLTSNGASDIFVAKLDSDGNLHWAINAGGNGNDLGNSIAINNTGDYIFLSGNFKETANFGSTVLTSNGDSDVFVAKLDSNGSWLWVKKAGGVSLDSSSSITLAEEDNVYVTGYFNEVANFGSNILVSSGASDIFVAKLDSEGNWLWAKRAGGTNQDIARSIAFSSSGIFNSFVFITGNFLGTSEFGSYVLTGSDDGYDVFVALLDSEGNWLFADKSNGAGDDIATSISVDDLEKDCYITGSFEETISFGSADLTSIGLSDVFVTKMNAVVSTNENQIINNPKTPVNYPNPFNPNTTIKYYVLQKNEVKIDIYNLAGKKVITLLNTIQDSGQYSIVWNGIDKNGKKLQSGIYFYKVTIGNHISTKKMVLMK